MGDSCVAAEARTSDDDGSKYTVPPEKEIEGYFITEVYFAM